MGSKLEKLKNIKKRADTWKNLKNDDDGFLIRIHYGSRIQEDGSIQFLWKGEPVGELWKFPMDDKDFIDLIDNFTEKISNLIEHKIEITTKEFNENDEE